jgi:hypothetical protein
VHNAPVLVLALLIAIVSVPTVAGMTAWGLTGGDGEAESAVVGLLGAVVGFGAMYNVVASWLAFFDMAAWQWYLMWAPPVAGVLALLLTSPTWRREGNSSGDVAVGLLMQLSLAIPAALVWAAGASGT